ncbi:MAG: glycoside hydrolase family 25 protein [Treponemataceae bacterium]|nr:glycoside hydrolase family 25 protein [Treponemataceae bacterium]
MFQNKKHIAVFAAIFSILFSAFFSTSLLSCASNPESEEIEEIEIPEGEISFRDYSGVHSFPPNENVKKHPYLKENFKKKGQRIIYVDENYECIYGVDVSRHLGRINWKKVKKSGIDYAFIRIGWRGYESGILHVDERFHQNIKGALAAGLKVGVYVFSQAINEQEALEEAELALEQIKGYEISLPIVFDPEHIYPDAARTDKVSGKQFTKNAITFCEAIKKAGFEPMIYSNLRWQGFVFDMEKIQDYKMWYADYKKLPRTPYDFEFWQFTCEGKIRGIRPHCDIDLWIKKVEPPAVPVPAVPVQAEDATVETVKTAESDVPASEKDVPATESDITAEPNAEADELEKAIEPADDMPISSETEILNELDESEPDGDNTGAAGDSTSAAGDSTDAASGNGSGNTDE